MESTQWILMITLLSSVDDYEPEIPESDNNIEYYE
jgi:hypothetical protein